MNQVYESCLRNTEPAESMKIREAISNTKSFDGTDFASDFAKIWGSNLAPSACLWFRRPCEIFKRRVGNGMLTFRENDGGLAQE